MRLLVVGILLSCMLFPPCIASANEERKEQRIENVATWINWLPADWEKDPASTALAGFLMENTERADLPEKLHDWICNNIYYDIDAQTAGTYSALSPGDVLQERRGVCEAIANLTQSLFLSADIPCIKVWGVAISEEDNWDITEVDKSRINHTWNEYYMDDRWISLDCTMDMGNTYSDGKNYAGPYRKDYLHPEEAFFAKTHIKLFQEDTPAENIPDTWAMTEIIQAVENGTVPMLLLKNYRGPITREEFRALMDSSIAGEGPLTRMEAAMDLSQRIQVEGSNVPYQDVGNCSVEELQALGAMYQTGIMRGDGKCFCPSTDLTRQEAIVLANRMRAWEETSCT